VCCVYQPQSLVCVERLEPTCSHAQPTAWTCWVHPPAALLPCSSALWAMKAERSRAYTCARGSRGRHPLGLLLAKRGVTHALGFTRCTQSARGPQADAAASSVGRAGRSVSVLAARRKATQQVGDEWSYGAHHTTPRRAPTCLSLAAWRSSFTTFSASVARSLSIAPSLRQQAQRQWGSQHVLPASRSEDAAQSIWRCLV